MKFLIKVMSILNIFTPEQAGLTTSEIAGKTGIPLPSSYRILSALTKLGLLERNKNKGSTALVRFYIHWVAYI